MFSGLHNMKKNEEMARIDERRNGRGKVTVTNISKVKPQITTKLNPRVLHLLFGVVTETLQHEHVTFLSKTSREVQITLLYFV
jgi:hypothetical protein